MEGKFDIFIQPELSNILELIKTKNIYIYMMICGGEVKSVYFYKKSCTFIRKSCEAICCIATINSFSNKKTDLFIQGFKNTLWKVANENNFKFLIIEDVSDNYLIIENLTIRTKPCIISPTAYFFYNYIYHTLKSNKLLILN